jgi:hypothetical protein
MIFKKYIPAVLSVLLGVTILWAGLYFLTGSSWTGYDNFLPPLLCCLFAFFNLLFSIANLFTRYSDAKCGEKTLSKADVLWTVFSIAAIAVHGIGFFRIFGMLSAG